MADFPQNCPIGQTYYYAPTFASSFWEGSGVSGYTFSGSTAKSNASGANLSAYLSKKITSPIGLRVEVSYNFMLDNSSSSSGATPLLGVGITSAGYLQTLHPSQVAQRAYGAWAYGGFFSTRALFIGSGPSDTSWAASDTIQYNVAYYAVVTLEVLSSELVSVRFRIPAIGLDETRTSPDPVGAEAFVTIGGPFVLSSTNYVELLSLYITGQGLPETCLGTDVGIAHGHGGWISIFEDESLTGNAPTLPQALVVDSDNLKIGKEILVK